VNILAEHIKILQFFNCSDKIICDYLVYKVSSYYTKPILTESYLQKNHKKT